jgi:hypothetical protein
MSCAPLWILEPNATLPQNLVWILCHLGHLNVMIFYFLHSVITQLMCKIVGWVWQEQHLISVLKLCMVIDPKKLCNSCHGNFWQLAQSVSCRLDNWGIKVWFVVWIFLIFTAPRPTLQPSLLCSGYRGLFHQEVRWQKHEADHLPPFGAEVKNGWATPALPDTPSWHDV